MCYCFCDQWENNLRAALQLQFLGENDYEYKTFSIINSTRRESVIQLRVLGSMSKQVIKCYSGALKRAKSAPWESKSSRHRKFGNHVTVHRLRPSVRTTDIPMFLLSHFLATLGAQENTDCTSMSWSIDGCWFWRTPRFVGKTLKSKLVEHKRIRPDLFSKNQFPGLIYCDQELLWLLNVIEDLSTRCKVFYWAACGTA